MSLFEQEPESEIYTYRLSDGNYIMAEEVDYDEAAKMLFIVNPVRIIEKDGKYKFTQYLITDPSSAVTLKDEHVVATAIAPMKLKNNYLHFNILNSLQNVLSNAELNEIIKLMFPVVDSKDTINQQEEEEEFEPDETESWKVDNGISKGFDFNKPYSMKKEEKNSPWNRY
jgi:hypothetical protein